ncbi:MAG TPA: hypothetical protein VIN58_08600 [Roseateles sp.]
MSRLQWLTALLTIAACMLFAHPYEGLRHDGILYLGQALLHWRVPALSQDTFFVGGSQDSYSVYAHLMVPLYELLGMTATHVGLLLTGWLAMLGAVLALLRRFDPAGSTVSWGLLAFAVMSPIYGGTTVIGYGEPFVTARTFAEPLLLWSLVALLAGRRRLAFSLFGLAVVFHPLMSLPVLAIGWCHLLQRDRRWLWLLAGIPAMLAAGLAGIRPWDGLLKAYDPYWWAMVENSNRMVMLSEWTIDEFIRVVLDVALLMAAARMRPVDEWTRLIHAVVAATVLLIGMTAVGVDGLHSVLLTQLQLWRVHWVAHLLAMAVAPWVVWTLFQRGSLWRVTAFALALALLNAHIGADHGIATLSLCALTSLAAWRVREMSSSVVRLACACIVLLMLALSWMQLQEHLGEMHWVFPATFWGDAFAKIAGYPTVAMAGFAMLMLLFAGSSPIRAVVALGLSAVLLAAAVLTWDQRADLARAVESPATAAHPFAAYLPPNATVYWPDQLVPVWSLLERSSHFASQQGAGLLFNRDTALIFGPRKEMYRQIKRDREQCRAGALLEKDLAARHQCDMPTLARLEAVCSERDSPDFLVLPGRLPAEPLATWQPPARRDPPQTFALYACTQLKTQGSS